MPIAPDDTKAPVKRSASSIKTPPEPKTFGLSPNVQGQAWLYGSRESASYTGVFNMTQASSNRTGITPGEGFYGGMVIFNASSSNSIYSLSNNVQPAACQLLMIIKS